MRVFEIKYFEPAKQTFREFPSKLTDIFNHPDRYRICKAFLLSNGKYCRCGSEGGFTFVDGKCENWLGEFSAEIIGEVEESRYREPDRFIKA